MFSFEEIENSKIEYFDKNIINSLGSSSNENKFKLYGWRFNVTENMPVNTAFIDFNAFTNDYYYAAKNDDSTSVVLLSRNNIDITNVSDFYEKTIKPNIKSEKLLDIDQFEINIPKAVKNPYSKNIIGSRRSINDELFYFGFLDSIIDCINLGFWKGITNYDKDCFLKIKKRNNRILKFVSIQKNLSNYINLKNKYLGIYFKSQFLQEKMINLVSTPIPSSLEKALIMLSNLQNDISVSKPSQELSIQNHKNKICSY